MLDKTTDKDEAARRIIAEQKKLPIHNGSYRFIGKASALGSLTIHTAGMEFHEFFQASVRVVYQGRQQYTQVDEENRMVISTLIADAMPGRSDGRGNHLFFEQFLPGPITPDQIRALLWGLAALGKIDGNEIPAALGTFGIKVTEADSEPAAPPRTAATGKRILPEPAQQTRAPGAPT